MYDVSIHGAVKPSTRVMIKVVCISLHEPGQHGVHLLPVCFRALLSKIEGSCFACGFLYIFCLRLPVIPYVDLL